MLRLDRNGFTAEQVKDALHGIRHPRQVRFRYFLLDMDDRLKKELHNVIDGEVSMRSLAQIKRTAKFNMRDEPDIDYLTDKVQVFCEVKVRTKHTYELEKGTYFLHSSFPAEVKEIIINTSNGWATFPLGVFLLSSPKKRDEYGEVFREVEAYDGGVILRDDKFLERFTVEGGQNYRSAVIDILNSAGITKINIEQTDRVLPNDREWEPGTEKLKAVNNLLTAINYTPIYVDAYGFFTSRPYRSPAIRNPGYTYKDDEMSVTLSGMEEELDIYSIANSWVAVLSDPEREPLSSHYVNDKANSPTSTVNRGRTIVDFRELEDIADREALDRYVERIAFEASQIYGQLEFETAIMPMHEYADVLQIEYSPLGVNDKYSETGWTIPLRAGGTMTHEVRRVVDI